MSGRTMVFCRELEDTEEVRVNTVHRNIYKPIIEGAVPD